jgi:uncharacterized protein (TIGR00369 family)
MASNPFAVLKSPAKAAAALLPSTDQLGKFVRDSWRRLSDVPGGKALFSRLIGLSAPYTGSIGAVVEELERGRAKVTMKDRRPVRNHLNSVHAVALVNLAELTGNIAIAFSMPDDARFIVSGLSIDYVKKARGTITGVCECPIPTSSERQEYLVPVQMYDGSGDLVATATLKTLIGPRKKAS